MPKNEPFLRTDATQAAFYAVWESYLFFSLHWPRYFLISQLRGKTIWKQMGWFNRRYCSSIFMTMLHAFAGTGRYAYSAQ